MPPAEVRVRLTGTLPDGTALRPTPQDLEGIWVKLPGHDWLMELRADTDGLVFPELSATGAGAPDAMDGMAVAQATSVVMYPTAPMAEVPNPSTVSRDQVVIVPTSAPESPSRSVSASDGPGVAIFLLLVAMTAGVLWLAARGKLQGQA
jgi:hypothetical protein